MDKWSRPAKVTYKRWKDPEPGGDGGFVGQTDEDQASDTEIYTVASAADHPEGSRSANTSGPIETQESNKFSKLRSFKELSATGTFTVDDALEAIGFGIFQWKISVVTGLAWVGDAMEMMILSILGPQLHCEWRLPGYQVALITSVVFIGMGFGSPVWGNVSDKYGRKLGLTVCMCWTLYYGLLSAFSPVYGWLLVLRGLVGVGLGGAPQSVTLYSEFLPAKTRGICITLTGAFWALGAVFEVLLALWIMPILGWRWLLGLSAVPVGIFICFCFWLPESPRFDVLSGRRDKAMATLTRIAAENGKPMPQGTLTEYKQNNRGQIKDLFTSQYWRTTLLLWFLWFVNAFSYYGIVLLTTELFQAGDACGASQGVKIEPRCDLECNYLTSADYKDLLWTTLAEFPGLLIVLFAVDYLGRKKTMAICFFMFSLFVLPLFACIGRVTLTIFIFISRAFISGAYQVVFIYTPEVFPTETRAIAMGSSSAVARIGALITPFVAQVMLRKSVYLTLSVYCGCGLLAALASLILPIETLGRGLQESSFSQEIRGQTTNTTSQSGHTPNSTEQ